MPEKKKPLKEIIEKARRDDVSKFSAVTLEKTADEQKLYAAIHNPANNSKENFLSMVAEGLWVLKSLMQIYESWHKNVIYCDIPVSTKDYQSMGTTACLIMDKILLYGRAITEQLDGEEIPEFTPEAHDELIDRYEKALVVLKQSRRVA